VKPGLLVGSEEFDGATEPPTGNSRCFCCFLQEIISEDRFFSSGIPGDGGRATVKTAREQQFEKYVARIGLIGCYISIDESNCQSLYDRVNGYG
jgi:hypothetical protein